MYEENEVSCTHPMQFDNTRHYAEQFKWTVLRESAASLLSHSLAAPNASMKHFAALNNQIETHNTSQMSKTFFKDFCVPWQRHCVAATSLVMLGRKLVVASREVSSRFSSVSAEWCLFFRNFILENRASQSSCFQTYKLSLLRDWPNEKILLPENDRGRTKGGHSLLIVVTRITLNTN